MPKISPPTHAVIIPHYNDVTRLGRCLAALCAQDLVQVEIVVVDNGSTQDVAAVATTYPQIRLVSETEKGAAPARNRGVAETTAQWLLFLDADCVPAADWMDVGRSAGRLDAVVGGQIAVFDETPPPRSGAEAFETVFAFDQKTYVEVKGFSVTANLITTRDVFADVGPFRSGVSEDLDWCHRACAKGYPVRYEERLCVSHPSRSDWDALAYKWRRLTVEAFGLTGQGGLARIKWGLKGLAMPISILLHIPRVLRNPILSGVEKGRAVTTLVRLRFARMVWMLRQAMSKSL